MRQSEASYCFTHWDHCIELEGARLEILNPIAEHEEDTVLWLRIGDSEEGLGKSIRGHGETAIDLLPVDANGEEGKLWLFWVGLNQYSAHDFLNILYGGVSQSESFVCDLSHTEALETELVVNDDSRSISLQISSNGLLSKKAVLKGAKLNEFIDYVESTLTLYR